MIFYDILYIINLIIESKSQYHIKSIEYRVFNNINKRLLFLSESLNNMDIKKYNLKSINISNIYFLTHLHMNINDNIHIYNILDIIKKIISNTNIYTLLVYIYSKCNKIIKRYTYNRYIYIIKDIYDNPTKYKYKIYDNEWYLFINNLNNDKDISLLFKNFICISYLYLIYKSENLKIQINEYIITKYDTFNFIKTLYVYNYFLYKNKSWIINNIKILFYNIINNKDNIHIINTYEYFKSYYIIFLKNLQLKNYIEYNNIISFHKLATNLEYEDSNYEI
jgi:hypothetical protein